MYKSYVAQYIHFGNAIIKNTEQTMHAVVVFPQQRVKWGGGGLMPAKHDICGFSANSVL